ncbi:DEAD-box ATP-dependent RNA helicase 7 [Zea mays]|nr:DEAD-box ATP-dependent RNA helicase 7 [Zea mays]|eukprot:XP_020393291.1 DEAD-box ATP-dependent RNA helicase 7 [Zea mays]
MALRRGVDIVVGTPGRVKDFIVKATLNLKCLKFRVLDEADEMLNMGFVDDVELILGKVEDATKVQTLLFSATLPDWVNKLSLRFLKVDTESGVKFEHVSAPQPTDVAQSAGSEAADAIASVSDSVIPIFRQQAEQLLSSSSLSGADLLAKALAKAVGYTDIKKRSLLSSLEDYSTLHLQTGRPMWLPV